MEQQIPLNASASDGSVAPKVTSSLPTEVVQCLENARFLHLATCTDNVPHVSLMNYTYLPSSPFSSSPVIVMTTNPASRKMHNLVANPNVSLLVHDWVSHRPPTTSSRRLSGGSGSSPGPEHRSSLASLLLNLNTQAMSSISTTLNGAARVVPAGSDEEAYYRRQHLDNNTFDDAGGGAPYNGGQPQQPQQPRPQQFQRGRPGAAGGAEETEDGGRSCFVAGEEVRVIVVGVRDVRIADWKGEVRDWVVVPEAQLHGVNGGR